MTRKQLLALALPFLLIMGLLTGCAGAGSSAAGMGAEVLGPDIVLAAEPNAPTAESNDSSNVDGELLALASSPTPSTAPNPNPSSWAVGQVTSAVEQGLVPEHLQYDYTQPITREEFCALAVVFYENMMGEEITDLAEFNDTVCINVQKIGGIGIVTGVGNGNFAPDDTLTREQAAVILTRLAEAVGQPFPIATATFSDNDSISSWAIDAVGRIQAAGIMGGTGNNMFSPHDSYTREQSIITVLRTYDYVMDPPEPATEPPATTNPGTEAPTEPPPPTTTTPPVTEPPVTEPTSPPVTTPEPTPGPTNPTPSPEPTSPPTTEPTSPSTDSGTSNQPNTTPEVPDTSPPANPTPEPTSPEPTTNGAVPSYVATWPKTDLTGDARWKIKDLLQPYIEGWGWVLVNEWDEEVDGIGTIRWLRWENTTTNRVVRLWWYHHNTGAASIGGGILNPDEREFSLLHCAERMDWTLWFFDPLNKDCAGICPNDPNIRPERQPWPGYPRPGV